VLLFSEAVAHGTLDWTAPAERRVVMLKYCPVCNKPPTLCNPSALQSKP